MELLLMVSRVTVLTKVIVTFRTWLVIIFMYWRLWVIDFNFTLKTNISVISYIARALHLLRLALIVRVNFTIGGGNQSTLEKTPTCQKSLTNFWSHNVVFSTPCEDSTHIFSGGRHRFHRQMYIQLQYDHWDTSTPIIYYRVKFSNSLRFIVIQKQINQHQEEYLVPIGILEVQRKACWMKKMFF